MRYHLFLKFVGKVVEIAQTFCLDVAVRRYVSTSVVQGILKMTYPPLKTTQLGAQRLGFCLFVCLDGRQGEADKLNCNPLQRVGIPFFRDLASRPGTLILNLPSMVLRGQG